VQGAQREKLQIADTQTDVMNSANIALVRAESAHMIDQLDDDDRVKVFHAFQGHVKDLSFDAHGCRLVQRAFDLVEDSDQVQLVSELKGHVSEAVESAHGNHVLQRCVELMRPSNVDFILQEMRIEKSSSQFACHRYGCRVLERLIEHFPHGILSSFLEDIVEKVQLLVFDPFGNFVIQHLLEHGSVDQKRRIDEGISTDIHTMDMDNFACSDLDKALRYTPSPKDIAAAILEDGCLLVDMALMRSGLTTVERLLMDLKGKDWENASAQILDRLPELLQTKHGRKVVQTVDPNAVPHTLLSGERTSQKCVTAKATCRRSAEKRK
jgi:hypothetical protein